MILMVVAVVFIKSSVVASVVIVGTLMDTVPLALSNTKSPVVVEIVLSVSTAIVILPNVEPPPPGSAHDKLPDPSLVNTVELAPADPGST